MVNNRLRRYGSKALDARIKRTDRSNPGMTIEGGPNAVDVKRAVGWLNCAGEAREVARQLTDPGARKAVLELAERLEPP